MLTKTQANRLRGLIARHARSEYNQAQAGAYTPDVAKIIRADAVKAREAVYAELRKLTAAE